MNLEDTKPRIGPPLLRGRGEPKPPPRGEKFYDFGLFFRFFAYFCLADGRHGGARDDFLYSFALMADGSSNEPSAIFFEKYH